MKASQVIYSRNFKRWDISDTLFQKLSFETRFQLSNIYLLLICYSLFLFFLIAQKSSKNFSFLSEKKNQTCSILTLSNALAYKIEISSWGFRLAKFRWEKKKPFRWSHLDLHAVRHQSQHIDKTRQKKERLHASIEHNSASMSKNIV